MMSDADLLLKIIDPHNTTLSMILDSLKEKSDQVSALKGQVSRLEEQVSSLQRKVFVLEGKHAVYR